eukprot:gene9590-1815_t
MDSEAGSSQEQLAQMQAQQKRQQQEEEQQRQMAEAKNQMLNSILTQEARARLNNLAVVRKEKAEMVENILLRMVQTGQLSGKINEVELKRLLNQVSDRTQAKTNIKFARRELDDDDDNIEDTDSDSDEDEDDEDD